MLLPDKLLGFVDCCCFGFSTGAVSLEDCSASGSTSVFAGRSTTAGFFLVETLCWRELEGFSVDSDRYPDWDCFFIHGRFSLLAKGVLFRRVTEVSVLFVVPETSLVGWCIDLLHCEHFDGLCLRLVTPCFRV